MALGELLAVGAVEQRQVGVARRLVAERPQHEQLLRRVGEVVVAADDLGDPHLGVVDGDREVVEDGAVGAGDDEVVVGGVGEGDRAVDQVLDDRLAVVGDAQADGGAGLLGRRAAVAAAGAVLGLPGLDVLGGGGVAVGGAGLEQLGERRGVAVGAAGLGDRALVVGEAEPLHRVEDLVDVVRGRALAVGVLDPQDQRPGGRVAGGEPVVECRARSADVQGTGRRRRESKAGVISFHVHRRSRIHRRRSRQSGRARQRTRLRIYPDLQPEPAHVAADQLWRGRLRGVQGGDGRLQGGTGDHPRGLPDQHRHATTKS